MGYRFKKDDTLLIKFDEDTQFAGAEVRLRRKLPLRIYIEVGKMDVEGLAAFIASILIDWNLEFDDGTPIPANLDGVKDQPGGAEFILALVRIWGEAAKGVAAPLVLPPNTTKPSVSIPMTPLDENSAEGISS